MNLSESRVRQLHSSVWERLKSHLQTYRGDLLFSLSEKELQFVVFFYIGELSIQETARAMKLSESEVIDLYCIITSRFDDTFPDRE